MIYFIILASLAIGLGRFGFGTHGLSLFGTYEAFSHILVGFLLATYFVHRTPDQLARANTRKWAGWSLILITLIEIAFVMIVGLPK